MSAALPQIRQPVAPDPDDRLSWYVLGWLGFVAYFAILEGIALHQDAKHHDRVKRTLSANLRYVFATDSVTGVPLKVPAGRLRRFALSTGVNWFQHHIGREGEM